MDGMTGFNPAAAQQRIDSLYDILDRTMLIFRDGSVDFFFDLQNSWYSPKCVEFGNYSTKLLESVIIEYGKMWNAIMRNTVAAYNVLARANDCPSFQYDSSTVQSWCGDRVGVHFSDVLPGFYESGPNGEVGMNTTLVKAVLLPEYKTNLTKFYTALDELPLDIDFYDPEGELKAKFKELVVKFKDYTAEKVEEMFSKLRESLDTEVDNIEIAKEQAADTMNVAA